MDAQESAPMDAQESAPMDAQEGAPMDAREGAPVDAREGAPMDAPDGATAPRAEGLARARTPSGHPAEPATNGDHPPGTPVGTITRHAREIRDARNIESATPDLGREPRPDHQRNLARGHVPRRRRGRATNHARTQMPRAPRAPGTNRPPALPRRIRSTTQRPSETPNPMGLPLHGWAGARVPHANPRLRPLRPKLRPPLRARPRAPPNPRLTTRHRHRRRNPKRLNPAPKTLPALPSLTSAASRVCTSPVCFKHTRAPRSWRYRGVQLARHLACFVKQ
jgi:hypothetical protein